MAAAERLSRTPGGDRAKPKRVVNGNIRLGRFGGVEVRVNWSWLVILALIVWSLTDGVFPSQNPGLSRGVHLAMAIVAALLFFASLLLHELGHSWEARRDGVEIDGITLWLFGACRSSRRDSPAPAPSFGSPLQDRWYRSFSAWSSC